MEKGRTVELAKERLYKCLNCGFIFRQPEVVYKMRPINPGTTYLAIDTRALYYGVYTCPRCGSDAIEPITEKNKFR